MTMRHITIAILGVFLAAAIAGCGKKGPLEPPRGAAPAPAVADAKLAADEEPPIDFLPMQDGMGTPRATRGNDD
jgi:predicted small lipoprotein YifL